MLLNSRQGALARWLDILNEFGVTAYVYMLNSLDTLVASEEVVFLLHSIFYNTPPLSLSQRNHVIMHLP